MEETVEEVKDDAQTRFYKRHMKRTETPTESGRTPIFNFDEWNSHHYGVAFERSQAARKKYYNKPIQEMEHENSGKYELTIFCGMAVFLIFLYGFTQLEESPDTVSVSTKDR